MLSRIVRCHRASIRARWSWCTCWRSVCRTPGQWWRRGYPSLSAAVATTLSLAGSGHRLHQVIAEGADQDRVLAAGCCPTQPHELVHELARVVRHGRVEEGIQGRKRQCPALL